MPSNVLYFAVLPMIHLSSGLTEQVLTLFAQRELATEFFPDEVDTYISMFQRRADIYLVGGHVTGYGVEKEQTDDGRVVVRVTQNVG